jgi:hypothetical protein
MQQPAPEVTTIQTKTSTRKDKINFLLLEGIHTSAIAVIQAAGTRRSSVWRALCPGKISRWVSTSAT